MSKDKANAEISFKEEKHDKAHKSKSKLKDEEEDSHRKKDKDDDHKKKDKDEEKVKKDKSKPKLDEAILEKSPPEEPLNLWKLDEPFRSRMFQLDLILHQNLLPKKDMLKAQLYRIEYRMNEIKQVKGIIEKDIRNEFLNMLERLNKAEGAKLALLQHELTELQKDMDRIDETATSFNSFGNDLVNQRLDPSQSFHRFADLNELIEFASAKPFKTTIDVMPYDMPRELTQLRKDKDTLKVVEQIMKFKDEVISGLLKNHEEEKEKLRVEMEKQTEAEFAEWARLTDMFSSELNKYQALALKLLINRVKKSTKGLTRDGLRGLFAKFDLEDSGLILREDFEQTLIEKMGLDELESTTLSNFFDPGNEQSILYDNFVKIVYGNADIEKELFDTFRKPS